MFLRRSIFVLLFCLIAIALLAMACGSGDLLPADVWDPPQSAQDEQSPEQPETEVRNQTGFDQQIDVDALVSDRDSVAQYLHLYGHLPGNYLIKAEAEALGWSAAEGNLWDVAPEMSIGGDRFGNYEGLLPDEEGRKWHECDINYSGGYRGAERLVYSTDGLIFYTGDHYASFTQLY